MRNSNQSNQSRPNDTRKRKKLAIETCERRDLLAADLAIDVTDAGATVGVGEDVTYVVSYRNQGNAVTEGTVITVELPSGTSLAPGSSDGWTCEEQRCQLQLGEVEPGAEGESQLVVALGAEVPDDVLNLVVWADVRSDTRESRFRNNVDWSVTPIDREYHDLSFDITDNGAKVAPGEVVSYEINYKNQGQHMATNANVVVALPEFTSLNAEGSTEGWTCEGQLCTLPVGDVPAGESGSAMITVLVSVELPTETRQLIVVGEVHGEGSDSRLRNNRDSSRTPIRSEKHDLRVDISDGGAKVVPGGTVAYAVRYANRGDSVAVGSVISVALPEHTTFAAEASGEGWSCEGQTCTLTLGDVAAGASGESTLAITAADELPVEVRRLLVRAEVQASEGVDKSTRNNRDLSVTPVVHPSHNLRVSITDNGAHVEPGGDIVYSITYGNAGIEAAVGATITATLPDHTTLNAAASSEGWACEGQLCSLSVGDLDSAADGTAVIAVTVALELPNDVSALTIHAEIQATDGLERNNRDNRDPSVTPVDRDYHDLRLRITDNGARIAAGETVVYDVTYQNRGEHIAAGSTITVELPTATSFSAEGSSEGWTCDGQICSLTVGDVISGGEGQAAIAVTLTSELPNDLRHIRVRAEIQAAAGADRWSRNNSDPSTTPIDRDYHDLALDFTDNGATVSAGGSVMYTATYKNRREHVASGSVLTVELPEHTSLDASTSDAGWTCDGQICTLVVGDVGGNEMGEAKIGVLVSAELPAELTRLSVSAEIHASAGADARTSNNRDRSTTPVVAVEADGP